MTTRTPRGPTAGLYYCPSLVHQVIVGVDVVLVVDGDGDVVRPFSPGSPHFVAVAVNDQDHAHDHVNEAKSGHLGQ